MLKNLGIKKKKHVVKLMAKISLLKKAEAKNEKSKIISITESKQTAEKPKVVMPPPLALTLPLLFLPAVYSVQRAFCSQ